MTYETQLTEQVKIVRQKIVERPYRSVLMAAGFGFGFGAIGTGYVGRVLLRAGTFYALKLMADLEGDLLFKKSENLESAPHHS